MSNTAYFKKAFIQEFKHFKKFANQVVDKTKKPSLTKNDSAAKYVIEIVFGISAWFAGVIAFFTPVAPLSSAAAAGAVGGAGYVAEKSYVAVRQRQRLKQFTHASILLNDRDCNKIINELADTLAMSYSMFIRHNRDEEVMQMVKELVEEMSTKILNGEVKALSDFMDLSRLPMLFKRPLVEQHKVPFPKPVWTPTFTMDLTSGGAHMMFYHANDDEYQEHHRQHEKDKVLPWPRY